MRNQFGKTSVGSVLAVACLAGAAGAQTPTPTPVAQAAPSSNVVVAPTYVSIPLEIVVNRPTAEVWKRVGKFCDIGEWLRIPCTITSGKDGEFDAVRSVGGEVLIYTVMFDNSMLADDAAREKDKAQKTATFKGALENMKILAEGGMLPPAPGRRGGAPSPGGAAAR
jgi:hypothetical protein